MNNIYFPNISAKLERLTKLAQEHPLSYELYIVVRDTEYEMLSKCGHTGTTAIYLEDPTPEVIEKVNSILSKKGSVFMSHSRGDGSHCFTISEEEGEGILDHVTSFLNLEYHPCTDE